MCGIAGLVALESIDPIATKGRLDRALERLAPRGPDGQGTWHDEYCALAHARLAIIDLSPAGAQPMRRGNLVITYNGEIFNFAEVRAELASLGHTFQTNSDTEVLLVGWEQWGQGLLPRLTGMFAFAIWDAAARRLVAARDRFGEKPFVYAPTRRGLAFGSDLIACEAMLGETRPVDAGAMRALFEVRFVPEPATIADGVAKLPPGHWLSCDASGLQVQPWYQLAASRLSAVTNRDLAESGLRERFDAAVADRLVSDVPVGIFLSGGIDSALVAASVAAAGATPRTFTVGFEGSRMLDERADAAAVARHVGADHTEIAVPEAQAEHVLDRVFTGLDEPFADASAVPTFLVSQATAAKVKVVLTGDGADEVFAGYRRYWSEAYAGTWQTLPSPLRSAIRRGAMALPEGKENWLLEAGRRARRFVESAHADPVERQAAWMREASHAELDGLLGPPAGDGRALETLIARARRTSPSTDAIAQMLAADVGIILPGDMLTKVDRMAMANALESRAPFLDQRVVEWAFALPGHMKLHKKRLGHGAPGIEGKHILRTAFRERLPQAVFNRRKRGFEMPVRDLLTGAAADRLRWATDPTRLARQGLFSPDIVAGWMDHLGVGRGGGKGAGRRDTAWRLWTLLAFQEWARLHNRPEALT